MVSLQKRCIEDEGILVGGMMIMAQLTEKSFTGSVALVNLVKNYERWLDCDPAWKDFELYEAARGYWTKSAAEMKELGVEYVCAVHSGEILEVYEVKDWYTAGTTMRHPKYVDDVDPKRCEFVGNIVQDVEIANKYKGNTVDFFDWPKQWPVRVIKNGAFV